MKTEIKIRKTLNLAAWLFVFAFIAVGTKQALAQISVDPLPDNESYNDFVVGPGKTELNVEPGETRTVMITVSNRLGTDRTFTLGVEDFTGSDDPNRTVILLGDDKGPYSLRDYMRPATTSMLIPHGKKARIPVTISVPADAQPGGMYGSIVVGTVSLPAKTNSELGAAPVSPIITRIGSLFFIRVAGEVVADAQLDKFQLSGGKTMLFGSPKVNFDLIFKNKGNVHVNPSGTIAISNMLGSTVGNIEVEPWFAMPKSTRFRQIEWEPPFLFGRYVAHAEIKRGYADEMDKADIIFWVIPVKMLAVGLFIVIALIVLVKVLTSKFKIVTK